MFKAKKVIPYFRKNSDSLEQIKFTSYVVTHVYFILFYFNQERNADITAVNNVSKGESFLNYHFVMTNEEIFVNLFPYH